MPSIYHGELVKQKIATVSPVLFVMDDGRRNGYDAPMSNENLQAIEGLAPENIWRRFAELSSIPRCSKQEGQVREWLLRVAREAGLDHTTDATGNVLIRKEGSGPPANTPAVALQAHIDMVCEKNRGTEHDFAEDPIRLVVDGEWVRADRTTLGADNGIAVAMMVALLAGEYEHPPLECLFTVDEESGLTGALKLDPNLLTAKKLINIDSEEEGHFCIGCAGGRNSHGSLPITTNPVSGKSFRFFVSGLRGGHSGINIGEGRGNSVELGGRALYDLFRKQSELLLVSVKGGDKHNAIPREFEAQLLLPDSAAPGAEDTLRSWVDRWRTLFAEELGDIEGGLTLSLEPLSEGAASAMDRETSDRVVRLLAALPHGVLVMSRAVEGLVETSTNLAAVRLEAGALKILTSQRSSLATGVDDAARRVRAPIELAGGSVSEAEGYPAWPPNPDSRLLADAVRAYRTVTEEDPIVEAVHAGLECGVIGDKYPGMEMISFGPDIEGAHTPEERVRTASVERSWRFLLQLLREV